MPAIDLMDTSRFNSHLLKIIREAPMPGLDELPDCKRTSDAVEEIRKRQPELKPNLEAGLWLLAGDLERSHAISQSLNTREGSQWHAIMHRREGDYWNSKYWYRKAEGLPVLEKLAEEVSKSISQLPDIPVLNLTPDRWTSSTFISEILVDNVQQAVKKQLDWQVPLQRVCWWEWQLLFQHCWDIP